MTIEYEDFLTKLPPERVAAIRERGRELIEQEASLRQLRERLGDCSQEMIAKALGIKQSSVSKLERRSDMYIATLKRYIEAMGGELQILAQFPGQDPVRINQFSDITTANEG
jgi:predicted XRE-type DNA-binding protein